MATRRKSSTQLLRKILTKWLQKTWVVLVVLFVATIVAYGQTLWMYFWIDDNAAIYKLQHFEQNLGLWGKGLLGEGPYRHIVVQFLPFYPIFKTNPTPYFAAGVLLYFIATSILYFFVRALTKEKILAFGAAIIFAAGYVGSETMFGIVNSWQTARGVAMTLGSFWLYFRYIETKKTVFYLLAVFLFYLSLETVYIRAHGLIFSMLTFDFLFWPVRRNWNSIKEFIARQAPFVVIHYYIYLAGSDQVKRFGIFRIIREITQEDKLVLLSVPFQSIGNLFLPDVISLEIDKFIRTLWTLPVGFSPGSTAFGILFPIFAMYLTFYWWKREKFMAKVLAFSVVWMVSNMMVYFVRETSLILQTAHRYLLYSFVGLGLFWATAFFLLFQKRKVFAFGISAFVFIYLALGVQHQYAFNQRRSIPARNFYTTFDKAIPDIPKGAVLYFDIANDNKVKGEFGNFFGGIFSEGANLAIHSQDIDYMNDFVFTYDFGQVLQSLAEGKTELDMVYTFYYGSNGLVETTADVRQLLSAHKEQFIAMTDFSSNTPFKIEGGTFKTQTTVEGVGASWQGTNPVITIAPKNLGSLGSSIFAFSLTARPLTVSFPYQSKGAKISPEPQLVKRVFSYITARNQYRSDVVVSAGSFWRDQDPEKAVDGRLDTAWRGHRGFWDEIFRGRSNNIEYLQVDLKTAKKIAKVFWVSGFYQLVPTHYKLLTSLDGENWGLAKEVKRNEYLAAGSVVVDSFPSRSARFVKMEILKTYWNDGPELKEFEVVEEEFSDLNRGLVEQVEVEPFVRIETPGDFQTAMQYIQSNARLRFYWRSDADSDQDPTKYVDIPIKVDGRTHDYTVGLPASGFYWAGFTVGGFNFPVQVSVSSAKLLYDSP